MVVALKPLHDKYKIKRIVVSTYQSVTGTGVKAVDQLFNERKGIDGPKAYPYQIDLNVLPHIDVFTDNGYTKEERGIAEANVDKATAAVATLNTQVDEMTVKAPVGSQVYQIGAELG